MKQARTWGARSLFALFMITSIIGGVASPASASPPPHSSATASAASASAPDTSDGTCVSNCVSPHWAITHVGAPYQTEGAWHNCIYVQPTSIPISYSCSQTYTAGNTYSGTLEVALNILSASVGYTVDRQWSWGVQANISPPDTMTGYFQYTTVYATKNVTEEEYLGSAPLGNIQGVETHERNGTTYRFYVGGTVLTSSIHVNRWTVTQGACVIGC
jgi:hypothetical protein